MIIPFSHIAIEILPLVFYFFLITNSDFRRRGLKGQVDRKELCLPLGPAVGSCLFLGGEG
jgi:hypothetical protein